MVKIKGWRKVKHSSNDRWVYDPNYYDGRIQQGWEIEKHIIQIDIYQRVKGKNKGLYQVQVWRADKNKVTHISPLYTSKKEAFDYVYKFMRSHPNG